MPKVVLTSVEPIGDDCSLDLDVARNLLSAHERERATAFQFDLHRNRYQRGRGLLRTMLGKLLDSPPSHLVIDEEKLGKPYVKESPLSFNLSHSNDLAFFAFSFDLRRLGVDIELTTRDADVHRLSEHYFSAKEAENVASKIDNFFRIWTAKEARMKLTGEGLHLITGL